MSMPAGFSGRLARLGEIDVNKVHHCPGCGKKVLGVHVALTESTLCSTCSPIKSVKGVAGSARLNPTKES